MAGMLAQVPPNRATPMPELSAVLVASDRNVAIRIAIVDEGKGRVDLIRIWSGPARYLQPLTLRREHDRSHRTGFVRARVAGAFALIGPGKEPLSDCHWITKSVNAFCDRDEVDRLAA